MIEVKQKGDVFQVRKIKFRGKDSSTGDYLYGDLIHDGEERVLILDPNYGEHEVEPETVGQFTGAYDRKGNEIYEGDICEVADEDYIFLDRPIIVWDSDDLLFKAIKSDGKRFKFSFNEFTAQNWYRDRKSVV